MRYLNWDVLLFPGSSRVPMQEFKTACYAASDSELLYDDMATDGPTIIVRHLPIVACFMANQIDGSHFKVSIHSWTTPPISPELRNLELNSRDKVACFEGRVIVDGICVGSTLMMPGQVFPQIIEHSFQVVKHGQRDCLRWPAFHQELLTQNYWSATENLGRIKVTIAEGFIRGKQGAPFHRTRNLVTFSFQHAPQYVLENAGIAWPNPVMWNPPSQPVYKTPNCKKEDAIDPELHAHSPSRQKSGQKSLQEFWQVPSTHSNGNFMGPPPLPSFAKAVNGLPWDTEPKMADPFVERRRGSQQRSDQSMPDYTDSESALSDRAIGSRNSTMFPMGHIVAGGYQPREHLEELLHVADSPTNQQGGLSAPANTRANSTEALPNQVEATEQRQQNSAQYRSAYEDSDITMKSQFSEEQEKFIGAALSKAHPVPNGNVKSKKEGNSPRRETPPIGTKQLHPAGGRLGSPAGENDQSKSSSEGKRKRENKLGRKVSMTDHLELSSPRKVSKMEGDGPLEGDSKSRPSSASERRVLSALGNV